MSKTTYQQAKSILTQPSGFIGMFDYTLNPYSGCRFGCHYCYAAFFAKTSAQQEDWGRWLGVKENALELLRKKRKRPLINKTIYMSSVTDPYQPIEGKLKLTRSLLQELIDYHQVNLVIQTRGTLVTRDIDLLQQFKHIQVNMTVTTDDESVRKAFEPTCPPNQHRLQAIKQIHDAGIQTVITLTPLLPVRDPAEFAETLAQTGVPRFVVQYFHVTKSRFVAGTGEKARQLCTEMDWTEKRYQAVSDILRARVLNVQEGQAGFIPYWLNTPDTDTLLS